MLKREGISAENNVTIYKRELWEDVRFPDGEIFEDIATLYKVYVKADTVVVSNMILYVYRRKRPGSITGAEGISSYKYKYFQKKKRAENVIAMYPAEKDTKKMKTY